MDKESLAGIMRNTWRKLVEGSYKPADRLASSRVMMALSKKTMMVMDTFSTQDMASLMENMNTVAIRGQCRPFLMVCLVKVVAFKQERQINQLLIEDEEAGQGQCGGVVKGGLWGGPGGLGRCDGELECL
jgi:hypothetical protein